ncbi:MAG: hypothetical protein P1P89_15145 [Desulfobacterales bacterium]|nr:hypothetical protein [Desulfobacterales bacterium]
MNKEIFGGHKQYVDTTKNSHDSYLRICICIYSGACPEAEIEGGVFLAMALDQHIDVFDGD